MFYMKAIVIERDHVREVEINADNVLSELQEIVGGYIEAVPIPEFIKDSDTATAYIHDEGKYAHEPNMAATDFFVPGVGLLASDYIAGPLVLLGFDPETGDSTDVPSGVRHRALKIAREAFGGLTTV